MRRFKLQISNSENKKISFGKRELGEIGRDIAAAKIALGAAIPADQLPNRQENITRIYGS